MQCKILSSTPRAISDPTQPKPEPHANGVIGFVGNVASNQIAKQMGQLYLKSNVFVVAHANTNNTIPNQPSNIFFFSIDI